MTPAEQQRYQEMLQQAAMNDPQARAHAAAFIKTTTGKNLRDLSPSALAPLMAAFMQMSPTIQGLTGGTPSPYGYAAPYVSALNGISSRGTVNVMSAGADGGLISNNVLATSHTVQDTTAGFVAQMLNPYGDRHAAQPYSGISSVAAGKLLGQYMRENNVTMYQQKAETSAAGLSRQLENLRNSENGIQRGGAEDERLSRILSARENIDAAALLRQYNTKDGFKVNINGKTVRKYLADYKGENEVERARAMLKDLRAQGADVDVYNQLDENEKRMVMNTVRDNVHLSRTEGGDMLSDTDISQAQNIAEGKGTLSHIGKDTEAAVESSLKRASRVIKKFSGLFGTDDPDAIQGALRQINIGSILTEKGVKEANEHIRASKIVAAQTGQDITEVMKAQVNIARMMSPQTSAATIRDMAAFSMSLAQDYNNNPDSYINKRYTADERMAMRTRARANEQNKFKGLGFARLALDKDVYNLNDEQRKALEDKIAEMQNATTREEKAEISKELERMAVSYTGMDTTNAKIQQAAAGKITTEDNYDTVRAALKTEVSNRIDRDQSDYMQSILKTGVSKDQLKEFMDDALLFTAGEGNAKELMDAVFKGEMTDAQIENKFGNGAGKKAAEWRSKFSKEQLASMRNLYTNFLDVSEITTAQQGLRGAEGSMGGERKRRAEEAQKAADIDLFLKNGEAGMDDKDVVTRFTQSFFGVGDKLTPEEQGAILLKSYAGQASLLMDKTGGSLGLAIAGAIGDGSLKSAAANYYFSDEGHQKALQQRLEKNGVTRDKIKDKKAYSEAYWKTMQEVMAEDKTFSMDSWISKVDNESINFMGDAKGVVDADDKNWEKIAKRLNLKDAAEAKKTYGGEGGFNNLMLALAKDGELGDPTISKGKDGSAQALFMSDEVKANLLSAAQNKVAKKYKNLDSKFKDNLVFDGSGNIIAYKDKDGKEIELSDAKRDDKTGEYIIQDAEGKQEMRIKEDATTKAQSWKVVEAAKESKTEEEQEEEEKKKKEEEERKEEEKKKEEEEKKAREESKSLLKGVSTMLQEFLEGNKKPKVTVDNIKDLKTS